MEDGTTKLERIVEFEPAFDKRAVDPTKNYGIHGVTLRMMVKGPKGATQFVLYTGWQLPHVDDEFCAKGKDGFLNKPLPADLGYHSYTPMYDDQKPLTQCCEVLDGKPCYYDGSGLNARPIFDVLRKEGSDGVWRELEEYYRELFETPEVI